MPISKNKKKDQVKPVKVVNYNINAANCNVLTIRCVARNSQWRVVLEVWGRSPRPPEANGGLGAKHPAAGVWGLSPQPAEANASLGAKSLAAGCLGTEPSALENFVFFCKNNLNLRLLKKIMLAPPISKFIIYLLIKPMFCVFTPAIKF